MSKQILSIFFLAILFIAASFFAHQYKGELGAVVGSGGSAGIFGYMLLTAIFVVFVIPLDIAFLIPLGAEVWGPVPTALISIAGWTLGAAAAFALARRWGSPLVARLIGLERVRAMERRIPRHNLFWLGVVLRMLVSVDILSYALGLFSAMRWREYILATALGVTPFGFFFAYAGTLPLWYQIGAVGCAVFLATVAMLRWGIPREP